METFFSSITLWNIIHCIQITVPVDFILYSLWPFVQSDLLLKYHTRLLWHTQTYQEQFYAIAYNYIFGVHAIYSVQIFCELYVKTQGASDS